MQLERNKYFSKALQLLVIGLGLVLNISFLHGVGLLKSTYFEISREISGFAIYFTSIIGTLVICKYLVNLFLRFSSKT